jgi:hypothetical protein
MLNIALANTSPWSRPKVNGIVAIGDEAIVAAKNATRTIPEIGRPPAPENGAAANAEGKAWEVSIEAHRAVG